MDENPRFDHPPRRMPNDTGRRVAENLLGLPDKSTGSLLAMRWTKVDAIARIAVLAIISLIPYLATSHFSSTLKGTEDRLKSHIDRATKMTQSPGEFATAAAAAETCRHYSNLADLAVDYLNAAEMLGKVQVAAMGLPLILLVLMGIGEYWRFKAVVEMRKAMDFLRTPEGVERLRREAQA